MKIISDDRFKDMAINAIEWALDCGDKATHDLIYALRITPEELEYLEYDKDDFPKMYEWAKEWRRY